ncbi:MAG: N-methyl-L-tryptophan oxidase [Acidimicrobiales bacterium]
MRRADLVVVGGGLVGSATAWWAARSGLDVVMLERFEAGHQHGSSHGGTRIFRLAYPQVDYVRLAHRALELWRQLEDEADETLLELTGGIDLGHGPSVTATAAGLSAAGERVEWLDAAAATERWPGFAFTGPVLFQPEGGRCWAERSVAALARRATAHGAEVRYQEPVRSLAVVDGHGEVRTDLDTYRAPQVVLAAGAWVADLAQMSGLVGLPPLVVSREQPAHFAPIDAASAWPSFIEHSGQGAFVTYGLQEPGLGIKLGEHMVGPAIHPDRRSFEIDPVALGRISDHAQRLLPGVHPEPVAVDTCLYTSTANEDFVIDRRGPFTVASACSGHGFKFGPATGELVAEVALGRRATLARFALPS